MTVKIALDVSALPLPTTGIGKYLRLLLEQYLELFPEHQYTLYCLPDFWKGVSNYSYMKKYIEGRVNVRLCLPYFLGKVVKFMRQFYAIDELFLPDIQVYHGQAPYLPGFGEKKRVVMTVHDIIPVLHPEWVPPLATLLWNDFKKRIKSVSCFIADSEHTKRDLVNMLGVSKEMITVIPLAVSPEYMKDIKIKHITEVCQSLGIKDNYLLTVSALEPRKNLPRLIHAYNLLRKQGEFNGKLVVVGAKKKKFADLILQVYKSSFYYKDILFFGNLPDDVLACLYKGASAFAFVSLYEGFGLPILESFASGVPLVLSNISSHPEVAGDAAQYVDPMDIESIAEGLSIVLRNKGQRAELIQRGYERLKQYSWQETAQKTFQTYLE